MKIPSSFKLFFLFIFLLGLQNIGFAQSREMKVSPLRFAGVYALSSVNGESEAFLVIHSASGGNWNFELLDAEMNDIQSGTIEAPAHSFFNSICFNEGYTAISFVVNAFTPSITYVVLDITGHEVARTTRYDAPNLRRGDQFFPAIYQHPEHGFVIVQCTGKGRSAGYTVEQVDYHLNTLWSMEFSGQGAQVHVYDLIGLGNRMYILEASERFGKTLSVRLHGIDIQENAHTYTMELSDGTYSYFPTALLPLSDNSIAMAGTYFNGDKINGKNTQGLFFMGVDGTGHTAGMELHPWSELKSTLKTPVPDWFFKVMPDVYIHALEYNEDNSYTAITELYRYSGEVSQQDKRGKQERYHRIRMLDFMLFNFDQQGLINHTERIERPHMVLKLDSEFAGEASSLAQNAGAGPLKRAMAMKKAGAFTYRFHQKSEENFHLAFFGYENKRHHAYLMDLNNENSTIKTDHAHAKPIAISYLQVIDLCVNQSGFGFILSELNTRSFDDSEAYWRGMLPGRNGSMLTYEYMPLNGRLKLNMLK